MEFDRRYLEFFPLWNERQFFECHETLEGLWLDSTGGEKDFFQGLVMCCAAFFHLERGNAEGSASLLAGALSRLEQFPPRYMSFPIREFVDLLATWQARVELMRAVGEISFDPTQLPRINPPEGASAAHLI